jgi:hypothetical protein
MEIRPLVNSFGCYRIGVRRLQATSVTRVADGHRRPFPCRSMRSDIAPSKSSRHLPPERAKPMPDRVVLSAAIGMGAFQTDRSNEPQNRPPYRRNL